MCFGNKKRIKELEQELSDAEAEAEVWRSRCFAINHDLAVSNESVKAAQTRIEELETENANWVAIVSAFRTKYPNG